MILLKILGIILAAVILLAAGALLLPVDLLLRGGSRQELRCGVRILGIKIWLRSGEEPEPSEKERAKGGLLRKLRKNFGTGAGGEAPEKGPGGAEALRETVETVKLWLNRLGWLLRRCRLQRCRIVSVSAGEDAPLEYGVACAVLYPLAAYLQSSSLRVRRRGPALPTPMRAGVVLRICSTMSMFWARSSVMAVLFSCVRRSMSSPFCTSEPASPR